MSFLVASAMLLTQVDPNLLPIGRAGTVTIEPGQLVNTATGKACTFEDFYATCSGKRFVFLGENHATRQHQLAEAKIVEGLANSGLRPAVGVEFFHRTKQDVLDLWTAGTLSEDDFLVQSEWKTQWGYGYEFYRPLFEVIRTKKLPVVGLNVPRDWVRKVGKGGLDVLPLSAKMQLPLNMDLTNKSHRSVFTALMGGHDMGNKMDNVYAAQVLWDEGMADTSFKYLQVNKPGPKDIFVVIAGSGHIMYGQGINYRLQKRRAGSGINFVMVQSDKAVSVSRGLGDFVYVTKPEPK